MKNEVVMKVLMNGNGIDSNGVRVLTESYIKMIACDEQTIPKYVEIILSFFSSDAPIGPDDLLETFFSRDIRLIRDYKNSCHHIRTDSIHHKRAELNNLIRTNEEWKEFLKEMDKQTGRKNRFFDEDVTGVSCNTWIAN